MNVNFSSNSTILSNLTVYTMYVINVSAVSSGGIGPAKTASARTDAEGNIQVESVEFHFLPLLPLITHIPRKEPLPKEIEASFPGYT